MADEPANFFPITYAFTLGDATWKVVRLHATEGLSELYKCALEIATQEPEDSPVLVDDLIAQAAVLTLSREEATRKLCGLTISAVDRGYTAGHHVFEVVLAPALWALSQRTNHRIFQDKDAVTIVAEVLEAAGIYQGDGEYESTVSTTPSTREFCVQYGETDLAFVSRLLEEEGITFYFTHEGETDKLVLADATDTDTFPSLGLEAAVVVTGAGDQVSFAETVHTIESVREATPSSATLTDYDFTQAKTVTSTKELSEPPKAWGELYDFPARVALLEYDTGAFYYKKSDVEARAQVRLDAAAARAKYVRGHGFVSALLPGKTLDIEDEAGNSDTFLVTRIIHTGEAPEVLWSRRDGEQTSSYSNQFECLPSGAVWRPPHLTPRPKVLAPQSAIVISDADDGLSDDHYGRIKVQFHWDRAEEPVSCWLRVMQPMAGAGWGFLFTPRKGMEVVVQFFDGNPDRPFVTGCLYHVNNAPPLDVTQKKSQSVIRTQSTDDSGGYNELLFEDLAGEEFVSLRAQFDLKIEVLNDRTLTVKNNDTVTVEKDAARTVKGTETETLEGDRTVTAKANDTLNVDKDLAVNVYGKAASYAAETWTHTADDGITLQSGDCKLEITPDGITLTGPDNSKVSLSSDGVKVSVGDMKVEVTSDGVTADGGGAKVELTSSSAKVSNSGSSVEVTSDSVKIKGSSSVSINGSAGVKINDGALEVT